MNVKLHIPTLPPGAIVATLADGGALRNDGEELTPAARNPWYVLATVAGEQGESGIDEDLHARNRRLWNGWMCAGMNDVTRAALAEKLDLPEAELAPLCNEEMHRVRERFREAFPDKAPDDMIPQRDNPALMKRVYFQNSFVLSNFHFPKEASFTLAHFAGDAYFTSAHFAGPASFAIAYFARMSNFNRAHFASVSFHRALFAFSGDFQRAYFTYHADFRSANFAGFSSFNSAHFAEYAGFGSAFFATDAHFQSAHFDSIADFASAHFAGRAHFSDGTFKSTTEFRGARFWTGVPAFFQREMHQETRFSEDPLFWPGVNDDNAEAGKQAYTRLRQIAAANQNPDLEHFFLRQEMRCKEHLAKPFDKLFFKGYRWIADYGISVARPLAGLAGVVGFGWGAIAAQLRSGPEVKSDAPIAEGLGVSIGNTLPFLRLVDKIAPNFYDYASPWLVVLSAVQSIAGIVLIFFLALGLRNRFRLK